MKQAKYNNESNQESISQTLVWQDHHYLLSRYPTQHRKELRAWDSADLYLLDTLIDLDIDLTHLGIIHDHFGALSTALANYNPIVYIDSWMSKHAIEDNLTQNQIHSDMTFETKLEQLSARLSSSSIVIGKVPKQNSQLIALLHVLRDVLKPNTLLLLAGMDKHLSRSQYDLLAKHFGPSEFLPGVKKARIWKAYHCIVLWCIS